MKFNFIYRFWLTLTLFLVNKHNPNEEEQQVINSLENCLKDQCHLTGIETLTNEGVLNEQGNFSRIGIKQVKRIANSNRGRGQQNFQKVFANCTPGYAFAGGATAMNRFFDLCKQGIMRKASPDLIASLTEIKDNAEYWLRHLDLDMNQQEEPEAQVVSEEEVTSLD